MFLLSGLELTHPCCLTWIPIKLYFSDSASLSPWLCIDSFCLKFSMEATSPEKYPLEYCLACFLFSHILDISSCDDLGFVHSIGS